MNRKTAMQRGLLAFFLAALLLGGCQANNDEASDSSSSVPAESPPESPQTTVDSNQDEVGTAAGELSLNVMVWNDVCHAEGSGEDCLSSDRGVSGNGEREATEPGLPGVNVALREGSCAGEPVSVEPTDAQGIAKFGSLPAATYCISIDTGSTANAPILNQGAWTSTEITSGQGILDLSSANSPAEILFGWEFSDVTAEGPAPVVDRNCTDSAAFYADVTVPDGTLFRQGESFDKTWKLKNNGTCTWNSGYKLLFGRGSQMGAEDTLALDQTVAPGEIVDLTVQLTAPSTPGEHVSHWHLSNDAGTPFGVGNNGSDFFWVAISVPWTGGSASASAPTAPSPTQATVTGSTGEAACPTEFNSGFESQVLALINSERTRRGLAALGSASPLSTAARGHSIDMGCNGLTGHIGSDGSDWYARILRQGYPYGTAMENVYFGSPTFGGDPSGAMNWWMNSQIHRENILNSEISEIGVGYAYNVNSGFGYYTLVFVTPP